MNKLLIDKENNIEIKDNAVELDIKVKDLILNIKGNVLIQEICKKRLKLTQKFVFYLL